MVQRNGILPGSNHSGQLRCVASGAYVLSLYQNCSYNQKTFPRKRPASISVVCCAYPVLWDEHGLQGDSWIWVFEGERKVAIDTFSSMKHQIKADASCADLVVSVVEALSSEFEVAILSVPEIEPHEEL